MTRVSSNKVAATKPLRQPAHALSSTIKARMASKRLTITDAIALQLGSCVSAGRTSILRAPVSTGAVALLVLLPAAARARIVAARLGLLARRLDARSQAFP